MISIPPSSGTVTPVKPAIGRHRTEPVAPSRPVEEEPQPQADAPFIERRKGSDDRRRRSMGRGPYNQRAGRDRRKNPGRPSVDTEA